MEALLALAVLALFAPIVVVIAVAARLGTVRATVEKLRQRVELLEKSMTIASAAAPQPTGATPPPLPGPITEGKPQVAAPPRPARPTPAPAPINWESLLGVKFFAWVGGLALFLGVVFFIKYAFERNLITPQMRISLGAIAGVVLATVGLLPTLRRYRVPAQSVCLTGVLVLYADIYAAYSFYRLISLTGATVLMWIVTVAALSLAAKLESPALAWLTIVAGFFTPILLRTGSESAGPLFGYVGILTCAISWLVITKRWPCLFVGAAVGAILLESLWTSGFFTISEPQNARLVFLFVQALFLVLAAIFVVMGTAEGWTLTGASGVGVATMIAFIINPEADIGASVSALSTVVVADAGLIALAALHRKLGSLNRGCATLAAGALAITWLAEWSWWQAVFYGHQIDQGRPLIVTSLIHLAGYSAALFLLFAATPLVCGAKRTWPGMIAAAAGPLQFWFFHWSLTAPYGQDSRPLIPDHWFWLLPIVFALAPAGWIMYLVRRERVDPRSADVRLATQVAAVLAFVSLIFPVQFEREWITLGWAIEGLALILLYHWLPNRRLRAVALFVSSAAFVRLALNPAVLEYHHRTGVAIFNWYLYTYGVAGLCFFFAARWFGLPLEHEYERRGPPLLYTFSGLVCFLLMNIEVADYFSIGPTLTFSFAGNFARDMAYTIGWALFAFALLVIGIVRDLRSARFAAIALLSVALLKLFLHDLDVLSQLYRIGAFFVVAIVAIVASFIYQRFLAPQAESH